MKFRGEAEFFYTKGDVKSFISLMGGCQIFNDIFIDSYFLHGITLT